MRLASALGEEEEGRASGSVSQLSSEQLEAELALKSLFEAWPVVFSGWSVRPHTTGSQLRFQVLGMCLGYGFNAQPWLGLTQEATD